jgi:hypothetical protein
MKIDQLVNRPAIYASEDGVAELMLGLMLLIAGAAFTWGRFLPKDYFFIPIAIWLCSAIGMHWGMKTLKERITTPRGGYIALDEQPVAIGRRMRIPRRMLGAASVLAFGGAYSVFRDILAYPAAPTVAMSLFFAVIYTWSGVKYRLVHWLWLAAFSACTAFVAWERNWTMIAVILSQGAALTLAGGVRLCIFIRSHPLPGETQA